MCGGCQKFKDDPIRTVVEVDNKIMKKEVKNVTLSLLTTLFVKLCDHIVEASIDVD